MHQRGQAYALLDGDDATAGLCAVLLLFGNLLDGVFTLVLLQLDLASELNPLLRWIYGASPLSFMVAKLALVQFGLLLLWLHKRVLAARIGIGMGAAMYMGIVVYHLVFVASLRV